MLMLVLALVVGVVLVGIVVLISGGVSISDFTSPLINLGGVVAVV